MHNKIKYEIVISNLIYYYYFITIRIMKSIGLKTLKKIEILNIKIATLIVANIIYINIHKIDIYYLL